MTRATPEWCGATDNTPPPARVKLRVFQRHEGRCACGCNRRIMASDRWETDHRIAIINGGKNAESNLQPLLTEHHKAKTKADVAEKAKTYRKQLAHVGIKRRPSRPMLGTVASGMRKKLSGEVWFSSPRPMTVSDHD